MYNYSKLKGRIIEVLGTRGEFANKLGITRQSLSNKLQGRRNFTQDEIAISIEVLGLENPIPYFFTK